MIDENALSFISESREMIDEVEPYLIELGQSSIESGEVNPETTNLIFRLFHSIKGTAGFLGFNVVVQVTHEAETLLDLVRNDQAKMDHTNTDLLCRTCDLVGLLLNQIEATESDAGLEAEAESIIKELEQRILVGKGKIPDTAPSEPINRKNNTEQTQPDDIQKENDPAEQGQEEFDLKMLISPEMMQRFTEESDEQLQQVESALLDLENDPEDNELILEAFRGLHSFKGNCGFTGFSKLEKLSHKTETILDAIKSGKAKAEPETIQSLLHMVDVFRQAIAGISHNGSEEIDNMPLLEDFLDDIIASTKNADPIALSQPKVEKIKIEQEEALFLLRKSQPPPLAEKSAIKTNSEKKIQKPKPPEQAKSRSIVRQDIRVDLTKLDSLINLVGELVIAEAMVTRNPDLKGYEFENFERSSTHLNKIVRDLQDMTLSVRMIPVAGIFRKMIRLVHDLSTKAGKKIELKLLGEDTEIDKTVSELIADPLVHLVRNAIDHGIEPPQERTAIGKKATGELLLEAKHEGGEIWIVISDDGRGLNREKILQKGFEKGLIPDDGVNMSDQEVFELIFQPGFSTADKITDVSGRGVGMDVVKKNIEKIKGHIDIHSKPGQGSKMILRIPLTLAIIDGMLVRVGKAQYTIPLLSIRESIQVEEDKITTTMDGQELVQVRNELIPVVRLYELHNIVPDSKNLHEGLLVIVEYRDESAGILIDEIIGEQQAVIKGLSNYVGNIKGISGCTIMGDGEISLILDTGGLIKKAQSREAA
jgi:two-component system, chemotaxis family, sensor kinase CheA